LLASGLAGAGRAAAAPGLPRSIGKFTVKAQARQLRAPNSLS
jgi:hypothetical protein